MRCEYCQHDNPEGERTCQRCLQPLQGVTAGARPAAPGRSTGVAPSTPPRVLVPPEQRQAAAPPAPARGQGGVAPRTTPDRPSSRTAATAAPQPTPPAARTAERVAPRTTSDRPPSTTAAAASPLPAPTAARAHDAVAPRTTPDRPSSRTQPAATATRPARVVPGPAAGARPVAAPVGTSVASSERASAAEAVARPAAAPDPSAALGQGPTARGPAAPAATRPEVRAAPAKAPAAELRTAQAAPQATAQAVVEPADSTTPTPPPTPVDLLPPLDAADAKVEPPAAELAPGDAAVAPEPTGETAPEEEPSQPIVSVHRQVRLARTWRRAVAAAIDLAAAIGLASIYLIIALGRLPDSVGPARGTGFDRLIDATLVYQDATLPAGIVLIVLMVLYQAVFVAALGQTPGLMAMRCYVVATRQRRLSVGQAALRALVAALGLLLLGVGWSLVLVDGRRRALHDLVAGTLVGTAVDEVVTLLPQAADAPELALADPA